jgi:hypothetical protein
VVRGCVMCDVCCVLCVVCGVWCVVCDECSVICYGAVHIEEAAYGSVLDICKKAEVGG